MQREKSSAITDYWIVGSGFVFNNHSQERSFSCSKDFSKSIGVLCGSVVKCSTRNPRGRGFEQHWILWNFRMTVIGQGNSEPQPSTYETEERHDCHRNMTIKFTNSLEKKTKNVLCQIVVSN